jgi:hypothetical protein
MAQKTTTNEDFKEVFFRKAELLYPRLKDTFRYNTAEKRSEACQPTAANAAWSITVKMAKADAKVIHDALKAHYEDCRKRNSKLPPFTKVFGMKKDDETGTVTFEAKKKGVTGDGKANRPPTVVDGALNALPADKVEIWSGSIGTVKTKAFPTIDPDGQGGISLLLDTVQVLKAVYGSANLDGFEVDESYADQPAEDPFAAAAARKSAKPAVADMDEF